VDPAVADAVARGQYDDPSLSAYDRAVVEFVAHVVRQPTVPDDVFAEVRRHLSDREILEVLQVTGFYWSFGRVCTVLEIEIEDDHGTAVVEASRLLQGEAS
jgi:alkylhydroperoxidase family enzyme